MADLDPTRVLAKWKTNTTNAEAAYVAGAEATDKDPTALAIAAIPYMRSRILEAIDSGRVANGLRRSGKQGWLDGVSGKGRQNFSAGVNAADAAFLRSFTPLLAYIGNHVGTVRRMDNTTPAARKARMNAWFDLMSGYKTGA